MPPQEKIFEAVNAVFNVTREQLTSLRKYKNWVEARVAAAWLLATHLNLHPMVIGPLLGHSRGWAYWAIAKCEQWGEVDRHYARRVDQARSAVLPWLQLATA